MNYNSYLNPEEIKSNCLKFIEHLEEEYTYYGLLLTDVNDLISDDKSKGLAVEEMKGKMINYSSILGSLRLANKLDASDAFTFMSIVEEETIVGNDVIQAIEQAKQDEQNYGQSASSCYEKAYKATEQDMVSYWRGQGGYYDGLVSSARERKVFYQKKVDKFDSINTASQGLFTESSAIRKTADSLLSLMDSDNYNSEACEKCRAKLKELYYSNPRYANTDDESGISVDVIFWDSYENLVFDDGLVDSDWLYNNASKYGFTADEVSYLEKFYPAYVNQLYGLAQSGNTQYIDNLLSDLKNRLSEDGVYAMEECNYPMEAMYFLHTNKPELVTELMNNSCPETRLAIYEYLHQYNICTYKPIYDFEAYNSQFLDNVFYVNEVQKYTNCYAYAFGLCYDPRTGELLPYEGLQPGYLSGQTIKTEYVLNYENGGKEEILRIIQNDAGVLDLNVYPYEEGMTGGSRVALVMKPTDNGQFEYHWYYYDEETNSWWNKNGGQSATSLKSVKNVAGVAQSQDNPISSNPTQKLYPAYVSDKWVFVKYEGSIGSDYTADAKESGYTIIVEELYITREDGMDFK